MLWRREYGAPHADYPRSSPAVSSSVWLWRAHWQDRPPSCWRTNRPETWTRKMVKAVMHLLADFIAGLDHLHGDPRSAFRKTRAAEVHLFDGR